MTVTAQTVSPALDALSILADLFGMSQAAWLGYNLGQYLAMFHNSRQKVRINLDSI